MVFFLHGVNPPKVGPALMHRVVYTVAKAQILETVAGLLPMVMAASAIIALTAITKLDSNPDVPWAISFENY
jgi:hypothetical protein